jgi:hypothetical protein
VEKNKYFLVNLNADPSLNELLVYYLKSRTLVGREDAPTLQDIQLSGTSTYLPPALTIKDLCWCLLLLVFFARLNLFKKFFQVLGCISLHSYTTPPTSLYISTKERWVCMSILFLSMVQMLKHKRKVAGLAYTGLNLDIFVQAAHVCNLIL